MPCCKDCDVQFEKLASYFNHRRKEHPRFSCPVCGKVFGVRKKLRYHVRACSRRRNTTQQKSKDTMSLSNYKCLPIVTANELDTEFEIYLDRKFGKRGIFRNKKMCKFCCKTFVMASDFADHIRGHYEAIPLDATGVKSKFDFMSFMGLKIRETNDTDCSDIETVNKPEQQITECRVVITGERCKICLKFFKCITDLDLHNKTHHSVNSRNKILLVLRIGKEIISKIPLKRRYIRRHTKTAYRSDCKRLRIQLDEMYDSLEYSSNARDKIKQLPAKEYIFNNETYDVNDNCELTEWRDDSQTIIPSRKDRRVFCLQNENQTEDGNMTRSTREARGKETVDFGLATMAEAQSDSSLLKPNCMTMVGEYESQSRRLYADEYFESLQFSEPWKDELIDETECWYSRFKLEDSTSDEENCYCDKLTKPRLTPKARTAWEQEHYDAMLNDEGGNSHEISLHESPPIYKYSSDSKYQADFSFPFDERSYEFQVKTEHNEETNNNEKDNSHNLKESYPIGYKGAITVKDKRSNLTVNCSCSDIDQCDDTSLGFQDLTTGKAVVNAIEKYQEVLIKEEVMLDDLYLLHQ